MIPLVLLPGLLNDAELWRDQIAALSDIAACRVGDITRGETLAELADAVLAQAPPFFALAGFSLGGYVAQEILRRAPERVTRLALLDTSIRGDTPGKLADRRALGETARALGRFHGFGDRLLARYLDPAHLADDDIVGRVRGMTARLGPEVFLCQNAIERRDGTDALRSVRPPFLVLCGESDAIIPVAEHRAIAALVPGSRLVIVPGAGHMSPIERPEAVSQAMREWLLEEPS